MERTEDLTIHLLRCLSLNLNRAGSPCPSRYCLPVVQVFGHSEVSAHFLTRLSVSNVTEGLSDISTVLSTVCRSLVLDLIIFEKTPLVLRDNGFLNSRCRLDLSHFLMIKKL